MPIQNAELTTPDPLKRILEQKVSDSHIDLYANNAHLVTSYYDFQLSFGEILEASNEKLTTEDTVTIKMSPQLAKRLRDIITDQVEKYEQKHGLIPLPGALSSDDE
ncbi:MAG: DUF3467 domain-containing protein [Blastocatellales bacterium]